MLILDPLQSSGQLNERPMGGTIGEALRCDNGDFQDALPHWSNPIGPFLIAVP